MSGDDSFDPRSWVAGTPGPDKPPAAGQGTTPPGEAEALPEAWKQVTALRLSENSGKAAAAPDRAPQPRSDRRTWLAYAVSVAILLAGGAAAWIMRSPSPATKAPPFAAETSTAVPSEATPETATVSSRSLVLARTSDLMSALAAAGLSEEEARAADASAAKVLGAAAGEIRVVLNLVTQGGQTHLDRLEASFADGSGAVVSRDASGAFAASRVAAALSREIKVVRGELDTDSFYSSAVAAGVIDILIPEFINAFTFDFNLASEISPGDTFEVAYEQSVTPDGQPVGPPQLLFAQLVTATKRRALYRFKPADQDVGWFDGNGASTVRSFMRTPIDGARITSKFGPRFHPVLHYTRLHGGTDFAAPVGTPIYAAADGTVTGASPSSCAGNMVIIRHKDGYETRYFHLSRYADGLVAGLQVKQGFTVGFVGNTGVCTTGPHLHYEVHINGEKVDPLGIRTDSGRKGLEGASLAAFIQQRDQVDVARARQAQ